MPLRLDALPTDAALPLVGQVLGADLSALGPQLSGAWAVWSPGGALLGALALRPSPAHGQEVLGGAVAGVEQHEAARLLLGAAQATGPLYAYADEALLPASALQALGWREVSAYAQLSGPLPGGLPCAPDGVTLLPLADLSSPSQRLAAQRTYADRIGHTFATEADVQPGAGGVNEDLSRVALASSSQPLGICRAWLDGHELAVGSPGVHPDWRGGPLRRALLLAVCQAARAAGATTVTVDTWGDTPEERADDLALGLSVIAFTPLYASGQPPSATP
ncbi:hypothetical protein [Deinococcus multiflagellatus]|uniref:N-acetyltransferase domain-containing protein n=1 Tax=Deinococcus multiflagellatus TaxID=1656887 RepID=A0ABW1ZPV6_9DEIO|nr:hypothetical protein [Deinococcus multiflagellatus]MBZ9712658.1 hypothetical protein [Deinococcus multiflagellatus]